MRRQIFIYINGENVDVDDDALPVCWVVKEIGQMPGLVYYGDLKTAANHATGCQVVVLVSGLNIVLTHVNLPAMNKQRLARAVPYALEEHVASDIDNLHFAVGNRFEDKTACAVVERQAMDDWQQMLKNANIQADVLTSEIFGAPHEENTWNILINRAGGASEKALLRTGEQSGLAVDTHNLALVLKNALDHNETQQLPAPARVQVTVCDDSLRRQTLISPGSEAELPAARADNGDTDTTLVPGEVPDDSTQTYATPVAAADIDYEAVIEAVPAINIDPIIEQIQQQCEASNIEFSCRESEHGYLGVLSQGFNDSHSINLLQGEYSRREQLEKLIRPWRAAIGLAAAWLLIQGSLLVTEYYHLSKQDTRLNQQMSAIFKEVLPDARNKPSLQEMDLALKKLQKGGGSEGNWFELLSRAGGVISDTKSMTLRSIRYKDDKLDLDLEITDLASLDDLKSRLAKQAELEVEIVSASARGGKVDSRLQVQLGSGNT
ncbi:MAG: type II secretion system protein GspL [Gammaproteobacteria bacterium]|nr:type II secretion system protein GspL [Gammaproteobacteria bacterium]